VCLNTIGSDNVAAVSESDIECQASPPDSLPIIRQSVASSAIDDVTAYVDAAAMATTPVTHGDVVEMSEDAIQVVVNDICHVSNYDAQT